MQLPAVTSSAIHLHLCLPLFAVLYAGLRGYALSQCLKEENKKREAVGQTEEQAEQQKLKYDQPGKLVTLPSGRFHLQV